MISLLASVRAGGGLDRVDHAVQLLEDEWRKNGEVPLERLWAEQKRLVEPDAGGSIVMLTELVRTDLRCRFARGQTPTVAGYLAQFPELKSSDSRVLSLIYEEYCLAEERGDRVDVDSFCERYSPWKDSLVSQLQCHQLFSQAAGVRPKVPPFPVPGNDFEEFQLVSLLGRGGTSRVFLRATSRSAGSRSSSRSRSIAVANRKPKGRWTIRTSSRSIPSSSATTGCAGCRCPTARDCRSMR